jgi:hypothetical protein
MRQAMKIFSILLLLHLSSLVAFAQVDGESLVCSGVYYEYTTDISGSKIKWSITNGQFQGGTTNSTVQAMFTGDGEISVLVQEPNEPGHSPPFIFVGAGTLSVNVRTPGTIQPPSVQQCPFIITRSGLQDLSSNSWQVSLNGANSWSTISTTLGSSVTTDISQKSDFRIISSVCPTLSSNIITVDVMPHPQLTPVDKDFFSGSSYSIPSASVSGSTITVTANATGVFGAFNSSGTSGALSPQILTTSIGGTVQYTMSATKNGCTGLTKQSTVTVRRTPVVASSSNSVYKGKKITLQTDTYTGASYNWTNQAGQSVGTTQNLLVENTGKYKVAINKNGEIGVSNWFTVYGQLGATNENYVLTRQPQAKFTSDSGFGDKPENEITETFQYFDGLGRPVQTVEVRSSPDHHDVVQPIAYDQFGRQAKNYLPFTTYEDNGRIKTNATSAQHDFYQGADGVAIDGRPFSQITFEASALNRPLSDLGPGQKWMENNKATNYLYPVNIDGTSSGQEKIIIWKLDPNRDFPIKYVDLNNGYYLTGSLFIKSMKDEEDNESRVYSNKQGQVILKKVYVTGSKTDFNTTGNWAETYYIYDDFGNLVTVLPPEATQRMINPNGN